MQKISQYVTNKYINGLFFTKEFEPNILKTIKIRNTGTNCTAVQ